MSEQEDFEFRLRYEQENTASIPAADDKNTDPYTVENIVGSAVEPMMSISSGVAGAIGGGLYGLGTLAAGGTSDEATENVQSVVDAMTYKPRTVGGKIATKAIQYPFEKWAEGTNRLGEEQLKMTEGSPEYKAAWATGTKTAGDIIPMLLGAKAVSGKPLTFGGKQPLKHVETGVKAPVKAAGGAVKAIKNLLPRHNERAGRLLDELSGSDQAAIVKALESAKHGETAGQAATGVGRLEFSAVEKLMQQKYPTKYGELGKIRESQQTARMSELGKEAKTPEIIADAILKRSEKASPLYKAGREGKAVGVEKIVSDINELMGKNPGNLELLTELTKVKKGLTREVDSNMVARTSGQEVLSTVDGLKAAIANKDNAFIKGQLTKIKNDIIESAPKYKEGETAFREMSKPVNQMQVFQQLVKELTPRLGSKDRAAQFVNALENARLTIKKASDGAPRFESLDGILTKEQMKVVEKLRSELDRDVTLKQQGTEGYGKMRSTIEDVLAPPEAPGMISSTMMVFRNVMARLKGHASKKTLDYLAENWNNPAKIAKIMKEFSPEGQKILKSHLGKATAAAAAQEKE